jgi:2-phospho-L-lactate guanylyltransferase (CobY/MobA/RfbA family)
VIGRALWDAVPDAGFRAMEAEFVECDDLGAPGDVDTPADLRAAALLGLGPATAELTRRLAGRPADR